MRRYNRVARDPLERLEDRIDDLENLVRRNSSTMTIPVFTVNDLPIEIPNGSLWIQGNDLRYQIKSATYLVNGVVL